MGVRRSKFVGQCPRTSGDREGTPLLSSLSKGSISSGVQRQHHSVKLSPPSKGHSVETVVPGCSAPALLGGFSRVASSSPFRNGESQRGGRLFSRPNQSVGSEWMLHHQVFTSLQKWWAVSVDLFATSLNHRLPVYFVPMSDPITAGTDTMLQNWDHLRAYAFPPVAMLHQVLNEIRNSVGTHVTLKLLCDRPRSGFRTSCLC